MSFFSKPIAGMKPADSIVISMAVAVGVFTIYGSKVGPIADVHATVSGDPNVNASIKKAGWMSLLLVGGVTLLSRDLNVTILGGGAIVAEHVMHLHAEMSSPATGQIQVTPAAYQAG